MVYSPTELLTVYLDARNERRKVGLYRCPDCIRPKVTKEQEERGRGDVIV